MKLPQDAFGRHFRGILEYRPQIRQKANAEAWLSFLEGRNKRNSRRTRPLRPTAANGIRNSDQRFPHVGVTILNLRRQFRPFDLERALSGRPLFE